MKKKNNEQANNGTENEQKQSFVQRHNSESKDNTLMTTDVEDQIQIERKEAYIERSTQNLLRNLLGSENEEIIPTYDPTLGFIYKTIKKAFEEEISQEKATKFLERLTRLDILKKSFFDTVSTCPKCESTAMTLHYHCPKCKSHNLVKTSLTEHIPCGFIIEREKYVHGKCPRCKDLLIENQYRNMGRWYVCRECNEKFEHPQLEIMHLTVDTELDQSEDWYVIGMEKI